MKCLILYTNEKRFRNSDWNEVVNRKTILVQEVSTGDYYKIYQYKNMEEKATITRSSMAPVCKETEPYSGEKEGDPDAENIIIRHYQEVRDIDLLGLDMNRYPFKDNTVEIDSSNGVSLSKYRELLTRRAEMRLKPENEDMEL